MIGKLAISPELPNVPDPPKITVYNNRLWLNKPSPLSFIPLVGPLLFSWTECPIKRPSQPPNMVVMQPGLFCARTAFDSFFFTWLNYLDKDVTDINIGEQYMIVYTNVGLLSALIFTVWVAYTLAFAHYSGTLAFSYAVIWGFSSSCSLFSTILSIILIVALNETASIEEQRHLIELFNYRTFGFGSMSPLYLLYISILTGLSGSIVWVISVYGYNNLALCTAIAMILSGIVLIIVGMFLVSSLYTVRVTDSAIRKLPILHLSNKEIDEKLNIFIQFYGGIEKIRNEDDFIKFIRTEPSSDCFLLTSRNLDVFDTYTISLKKRDSVNTCYLRNLGSFTEKLARKIYNNRIDAECDRLANEINDEPKKSKSSKTDSVELFNIAE